MGQIVINIPEAVESRVYAALCGGVDPSQAGAEEQVAQIIKGVVRDYEVTMANEQAVEMIEIAKATAMQARDDAVESVETDIVLT